MSTLHTAALLFGHTDEDTALVVDDYPYGRTVRTQIRYWIETSAKHGDRFCSQTKNPKTGRWNKPKKSTYTGVGVMYRNPENGHIKWTGTNFNDSAERIATFLGVVGKERLNPLQVAKVAEIIGYTRAMSKVTWSIRENVSAEETASLDAEQAKIKVAISKLIALETLYAGRALDAPAE